MLRKLGFILVAPNLAIIGMFIFAEGPLSYLEYFDGRQQLSLYLGWSFIMVAMTIVQIANADNVGRGPFDFLFLSFSGLIGLTVGTLLYMLSANPEVTGEFALANNIILVITTLNMLGLSSYCLDKRPAPS
ncbi:MAG: hypothetical protein AAB618_03030 [Patescibacteria group bacterium]